MAKNIIETTDQNFESDVLKSEKPVLVDFWAPWCGPCRMIAPVLEELAVDLEDKIKVVKVDVDQCSQSAGLHNIRSIPTLMIFKNGEKVGTKIGQANKAELEKFINEHI